MGSSMSHARDEEEDRQWDEDINWLKKVSADIERINPTSQDFKELQWIINNKEKIIGNRRLIELLR